MRAEALRLGFDRVGIAPVRPSEHGEFYRRWLEARWHGAMAYLARPDAVERRLHPEQAFPGARSAIVVAHDYFSDGPDPAAAKTSSPDEEPAVAGPARSTDRRGRVAAHSDAENAAGPAAPSERAGDRSRGIIARYARGRDYHRVMKGKLLRLLHWLETEVGRELPLARAYVDTGPVLERELARRAGLGWFGRNTMLIHPRHGSYFFLGVLFVELELEPDAPFEQDHCGTCRACVDACPTGALLGRDENGAPVIDAVRCISYLTIENRGPIPRELRPLIGNRIFGCDICQEVCPWNAPKFLKITGEPDYLPRSRFPRSVPLPGVEANGREWDRERDRKPRSVPATSLPEASSPENRSPAASLPERPRREKEAAEDRLPATEGPSLVDLLLMSYDEWDEWTRGSALRRAGYAGLKRNVAVALGNWGSEQAVPALLRALEDPEPLVRGHAAWALGRVESGEVRGALASALEREREDYVREELRAALASDLA